MTNDEIATQIGIFFGFLIGIGIATISPLHHWYEIFAYVVGWLIGALIIFGVRAALRRWSRGSTYTP